MKQIKWSIGSDGSWRSFTKATYEAITLGVSAGVVLKTGKVYHLRREEMSMAKPRISH